MLLFGFVFENKFPKLQVPNQTVDSMKLLYYCFLLLASSAILAQTPLEHFNTGNTQFQQGNYAAAIAAYDQALDLDSTYVDAYTNKGRALHAQGDYVAAQTAFGRVIALKPKATTGYLNRAHAYRAGDYPESAILDYTAVLDINPEQVEARYYRAQLYQQLDRHAEAVADLDAVIQWRMTHTPTDDYSDSHRLRGYSRRRLGQLQAAAQDFEKALALDPNDAQAYYNRGVIAAYQKTADHGLLDFTKAIQLKPDFEKAYFRRGMVYHTKGDYKQALKDFEQVLAANPKAHQALSAQGYTYSQMGNQKAALQAYNKALELYPKDLVTHIRRGYAQLDAGNYEAAIADFTVVAEGGATYQGHGYNNRGNAKRLAGDFEGALADLAKAQELDSLNAYVYHHRALLAFAQNQPKVAQKQWSRAIELNDQVAEFYYERGQFWLDQKQYDQAVRDLSQVQALDPNYRSKETQKTLKRAKRLFLKQ